MVIFIRGWHGSWEKICEGRWSVIVKGSEDYNIKVKIENDEIIKSARDCVL